MISARLSVTVTLRTLVCGLFCAVLLLGCQAQPRPSIGGEQTREAAGNLPDWPAQARQFVVDREASDLRIVVYPAGALARLGHAHVIGGPVIDGEVALVDPWHQSVLRLRIDVGALEVDRPEWREDEGFERTPSDPAIAGTRENLRSPAVLDAATHPLIEISSLSMRGPRWQPDIDIRIRLVGSERELTVPVALMIDDDQLIATGQISVLQSEFGLEPFTVAGGQLSVADRVQIRFRILAIEQNPE